MCVCVLGGTLLSLPMGAWWASGRAQEAGWQELPAPVQNSILRVLSLVFNSDTFHKSPRMKATRCGYNLHVTSLVPSTVQPLQPAWACVPPTPTARPVTMASASFPPRLHSVTRREKSER